MQQPTPTPIKPIHQVGVGDVIAYRKRPGSLESLFTVTRKTATQFVTGDGRRFLLSTGSEIGSDSFARACVVGQDFVDAVAAYNQAVQILHANANWARKLADEIKRGGFPDDLTVELKATYDKWHLAQQQAQPVDEQPADVAERQRMTG